MNEARKDRHESAAGVACVPASASASAPMAVFAPPAATPLERQLAAGALLARRIEGDSLLLDDATMAAALDGSRPLASAEKQALLDSPLTLRRFRALAQARRSAWQASSGMLRAAADGAALTALSTDDGHWLLHFIADTCAASGMCADREDNRRDNAAKPRWRVILQLAADAPFAASLLGQGALLAVRDGAGAIVLQGSLDGDGECEQPWPFGDAPAQHFQHHGAGFSVARLGLRS